MIITIIGVDFLSQHASASLEFLINAFIILYVILAWSWDLPETHPECKLVDSVKSIVVWVGLHHCWQMFAPDPIRSDRYIQARIKFDDGSMTTVNEPVLGKMSLFNAILYGRHRKWKHSLMDEDYTHIRPWYAEYLAKCHEVSGKQAKSVTLFLIKQHVALPSSPKGTVGDIERIRLHESEL